MGTVVESRQSAGLDEGIDVERLADFFEVGDEFRITDAGAETQSRKAVDFREGSHQDEIRLTSGANLRKQVERVVQKLNVGFVERKDDLFRNGLDETEKALGRDACAGRIVGLGYKYQARVRRDGSEHRVQVVTVIVRGNSYQFCAEQGGNDGVNRKAILRDNNFSGR